MAHLRLTVVLVSLVSSLLLRATSGQLSARVLDLQVVGGDDTKGYVEATVLLGNGSVVTGPVCGTVTGSTATFACYSKSLLASNAQGTVNSIGGISQPTTAPVVSNLVCNSNGQVIYGCSFSGTATCAPGDSAAVSCNLTGGELAAIVIVCVLVFTVVFGVVLVGGILLCVFGCCLRQTVCYHAAVARRARRSRGVVQPQAHPSTSNQQPLQQTALSDLEPPRYQDTMAEGYHNSSPPPYKP